MGTKYGTHILEINYRSSENIVHLSQRLIRHNKRRVEKRVAAASKRQAEIAILGMPTLEDSVEFVKELVQKLLADDGFQNIALVGRKRSQIIPYQIVFAGADIPFYAAEDLHVMLSGAFAELKAMLLLKAQAKQPLPFGPDPVEALLKLCDKIKRFPLSKTDRGELKAHIVARRPQTLIQAIETLYDYKGPLKGNNLGGSMTASFCQSLKRFVEAKTVAETIRIISDDFAGLQKDYGKSLDDIFYADPPFLYLSDYAERYGEDYAAFYQDVEKAIATLVKVPPEDDESEDETWKRPLHLMTALRAKGKEFDAVVLLDCNDGIWPSKLAKTEAELEAERRLFYVAFTRARKKMILLVNDMIFGEICEPTRYLREMGLVVRPYQP